MNRLSGFSSSASSTVIIKREHVPEEEELDAEPLLQGEWTSPLEVQEPLTRGNEGMESKPVVEKTIFVKFEKEEEAKEDSSAVSYSNEVKPASATVKLKKVKPLKPAICTKCHTGFPSADLYELHMSTVHKDDRPYACRHCEKRFAKLTETTRHETIHNPNRFKGPPQFACDMCDKRYHLKVSLKGHRRKAHLGYIPPKRPWTAPLTQHHSTNGVKNPNPYRKPAEIFPCPHCDLKFNMKCILNKHMLCHTKETPFSCPICQQPFSLKTSMKTHIKRVHEADRTPSGMHHPTRWQAGKPFPCTVCGKVYKTASQLRYHTRVHTGEKPHECHKCGKRFRMVQGLRSHQFTHESPDSTGMKSIKCRVCGKDGFNGKFSNFFTHRQRTHRHISYQHEHEKAFTCGICGKPYFQRIKAAICALLGHDPSSLLKTMFKHKCPECPPEKFGYHNLAYLRRHWEQEHSDKTLPVEFRKGLYNGKEPNDYLPSCVMDKEKAAEIEKCGIPDHHVKNKSPLFTELDLFQIPEEEQLYKKIKHKGKRKQRISPKRLVNCQICGMSFNNSGNLKRHLKVIHDPTREVKTFQCSKCDRKFRKIELFQLHEKTHQREDLIPKIKSNRQTRTPYLQIEKASSGSRNTNKALIRTRNTLGEFSREKATVNLNDIAAVERLLNYKTVCVQLTRVNSALASG